MPEEGLSESLAAAISVADAALALAGYEFDEAKRKAYYYDTANEKIWRLGPGGRSGNCDLCVDAADEGWVEDEFVYEGTDGDIDGPPAHPNCECELEYRERRYRVYA